MEQLFFEDKLKDFHTKEIKSLYNCCRDENFRKQLENILNDKLGIEY